MTHAREQIRDALITVLNGLTETGSNVAASRIYSVTEASLPHLSIYTLEEELDADRGMMGDKEYRNLEIIIEARAKLTAALDDQLDQIALEVELAITADDTLGIGVKSTELQRTEIELDKDSDQPTGLMRMIWNVAYRIDRTNPELLIP